MRLFIAVNFDDEIKNGLCEIMQQLQARASHGNFTRRENLHLTLAFLGETGKPDPVKRAMNRVSAAPFPLSIAGLGKFRREGGDLFWVGVESNDALNAVHSRLWAELSQEGFVPENRAFKPHLTLGREVLVKDFDSNEFAKTIAPMRMNVTKLSLMKSERLEGRLTYTEIYSRQLENAVKLN